MKPSDLKLLMAKAPARPELMAPEREPVNELEVTNVELISEQAATGAFGAFAPMEYRPDLFKAYITFDICHSFPQILGPTSTGGFLGYHPAVLEANHRSLLHQWMNLRHKTKANDVAGKERDRIVGCIVSTWFPPAPPLGWKIPETKEQAPCIKACAVLFKLAEGMNRVLGDHQTSRQPWSVSIEVDATIDQLGLYLPSTREIWPLSLAPDDLLEAVSVDRRSGNLVVGQARGEQLAFAYGNTSGQIFFRGVGMTPNPAEKTARITSIMAEDGSRLYGIAAEGIEEALLIEKQCRWGAYAGRIREVKKEGTLIHPTQGWHLAASEEDPALKIYLADGTLVMKRFSEIDLAA